MNPTPAPTSLYGTLDVSESASQDEIKRAYYRLVRTCRPDSNPTAFKSIKEAFEILGDPERRRKYDQMRAYGEAITNLTDEAVELLDGNPEGATRLLKRAVVLAPDLTMPRMLLGQALIRLKDYSAAEGEFRRLISAEPKEPFHHYSLGGCLWLQGRNFQAKEALSSAIQLEPHYHDAIIMLSRIFEGEGNVGRAIQELENAILVDGRETFGDLDELIRLFALCVVDKRKSQELTTAQRIKAIIPEEEEAANYAMAIIHDRSLDFASAGNFKVAYSLLQLANHQAMNDVELRRSVAKFRYQFEEFCQAETLLTDVGLTDGFKALIYAKYFAEEGEFSRTELENIFNRLMYECAQNPASSRRSISRIRQAYPRVSSEMSDALDGFWTVSNESAPSNPPAGGESGCMLVVAALIVFVCILLV